MGEDGTNKHSSQSHFHHFPGGRRSSPQVLSENQLTALPDRKMGFFAAHQRSPPLRLVRMVGTGMLGYRTQPWPCYPPPSHLYEQPNQQLKSLKLPQNLLRCQMMSPQKAPLSHYFLRRTFQEFDRWNEMGQNSRWRKDSGTLESWNHVHEQLPCHSWGED